MFGYNLDKKYLYIMLAIFALTAVSKYSSGDLISLLLTLPGVIIAITFHEFAHAYAADKLGDTTPRQQGRLNLNPLSHIDPVGFFLLIFAHFGWGKPVQITPSNFTKNVSIETGEAIVSIAGPAMNLFLAIVFSFIYFLIIKLNIAFTVTRVGAIIVVLLLSTITVNIGLCVFNLIPLPPLDGSKIFKRFLPYNAKSWIENNETTLHFIFLILWITGLAGQIVAPVISIVTEGLFMIMGLIFGV